jgi:hypothetical protein
MPNETDTTTSNFLLPSYTNMFKKKKASCLARNEICKSLSLLVPQFRLNNSLLAKCFIYVYIGTYVEMTSVVG